MAEIIHFYPEAVAVFVFFFGLLWGSFSNVVIYRLPTGKSVVTPRSACKSCDTQISWYDNFPVLSWLLLRGKCRNCGVKISWRYPLVELLMGVSFLLVYLKFGTSWFTIEALVFCFGLITVSFIDFDHMILPDSFTLSGIVLGLIGGVINPEREFMPAFLGFLFGGGSLWAVAYIYTLLRNEEGMGGGDIKLLAWIGAVLTWTSVPFVVLVSSIIGTIVGLLASLKSKKGLKTEIPFGPYLALAAVLYMFVGEELTEWYLNLFIPSLT